MPMAAGHQDGKQGDADGRRPHGTEIQRGGVARSLEAAVDDGGDHEDEKLENDSGQIVPLPHRLGKAGGAAEKEQAVNDQTEKRTAVPRIKTHERFSLLFR